MIWIIRKKEKIDFIWQVCLVVITYSSVLITFNFFNGILIDNLLSIYSFNSGLWYLVAILISYQISKIKYKLR